MGPARSPNRNLGRRQMKVELDSKLPLRRVGSRHYAREMVLGSALECRLLGLIGTKAPSDEIKALIFSRIQLP